MSGQVIKDHAYHNFTFAGGVFGLVVFLAIGLLPSLVYGGFAGTTLAAGLLGHSIDASLVGRAIVLFGMIVGLLATAGVFVVIGAVTGAAAHAGTKALKAQVVSKVRSLDA